MQKLESASIMKARNSLDVPVYCGTQAGQLSQNMSPENNRRSGIPPSHPNSPLSLPYSQSQMMGSRSNANWGASHCRSLSQSSGFDCLPPLSSYNPMTYRESSVSDTVLNNMCMEETVGNSHGLLIPSPDNRVNASRAAENLPPPKGHRRSSSDIPLGFSAMIQSTPQLIPIGSRGIPDVEKPIQLVKRVSEWNAKDGSNNAEGISEKKPELVDDLISEYMNLDNIDTLNSSGTEDKDLDSRASGTKTNGGESSDNEVESHASGNLVSLQGTSSSQKREGVKRRAVGDIAPTVRHHRSLSMDSYMGNFQFDEESTKLPFQTQISPGSSIDGNLAKLSLELNGEFTEVELKKILANDKLAEIALSDPKRAKRILANRQSAARSKERKMRYIAELEQKVQTLQTEATTLSTQVTMLQRDQAGLTSENKELKFRLQAMEQQAQLKDALNDALAAEVQRLKLPATEVSGETLLSSRMAHQLSISHQMFQMQHQQPNQINVYELQQQPQLNQLESQEQNGEAAIHDPK
ncbi:bZIP transcription factor 29-like [Mangifera indica]|uniref:bZIP transcription factor 29-like n=1 Tax=Mangifera indica TaxID=29780 RepID=UPI001CFA5D57|nr:bZIP transcription factor 29-like [Mangifera indica]XP_044512068.1 bZIP transcription factor 29-like [Mangifera indica]XP_044512069.1 bZIP transcription factor 29-like [Mangifera indica]XP_044512070.1 bZIP transcription factor 29-like [Mangifera indica]